MSKITFPSVYKRPAGFSAKMEAAVVAKAEKFVITADMIRAVIEGSEVLGDDESPAEAFLRSVSSIPPMNVWWSLEKKEVQARALDELGEYDVEPVANDDYSAAAERLRKRYVYCAMRNEVWDRHARDWLSLQSLDNLEAVNMPRNAEGRVIDAWKILRTDPDAARVHNERYMPGVAKEIAQADGVEWLNLWKAPTLVPKQGNPKPMIDHILYLCNGKMEETDHILDWMAYMYQNPGKKINHALLIISPSQGTGKDTVGDQAASRLFGGDNIAIIGDDAVAEGRYHFMRKAQLVVVPEIMSGDRKDIANKLKPLITQPKIEINEKHIRPYTIQNVTNFMFFSNHENAAQIEDQDRRYFVVICRGKPRSPEYFVKINKYISGPEFAGFAYFLKNRDLSKFSPYAPAPWTADKKVVQEATRGGVEAWLDDAYESQAAPFHKYVLNLRDALAQISQTDGAPRMTIQQLSSFLTSKKGAVSLGPKRVGDGGKQIRVFAIRDAEKVAKMPESALAALYEGKLMSIVESDHKMSA